MEIKTTYTFIVTPEELQELREILSFAQEMSADELHFYRGEGEEWEDSRKLEEERLNTIEKWEKKVTQL